MARIIIPKQPGSRIRPEWPLSRKLKVWVYQYIIPLLAYPLIRGITLTYRWRLFFPQETIDLVNSGQPFAVAVWHGDMVLIQSFGRRLGLASRVVIMVALSQAGEVETRILRLLGYHVVRGSEKERGKEALKEMIAAVQQGAIPAFVVDGPSGPARKVKPGVIYLAQHCQVPIIPVAFIPGNEWKLPTWDNTRIPKPFSRCLAIAPRPVSIPQGIEEEQIEVWAQGVADYLLELEKRDISWDKAQRPEVIGKAGGQG